MRGIPGISTYPAPLSLNTLCYDKLNGWGWMCVRRVAFFTQSTPPLLDLKAI